MHSAKCTVRRSRDREKQNTQGKSTREDVRASRKKTSGVDPKDFIIYFGLTWLQGEPAGCLPTGSAWPKGGSSPQREGKHPRLRKVKNPCLLLGKHSKQSVIVPTAFLSKSDQQIDFSNQSSLPHSPNHGRATLGWLQHSGDVIPQTPGPKPSRLLSYI